MRARYIFIGMVMLMASTCDSWEPATCRDGRLCPPGTTCASAQDVYIATSCGNGILDKQENEDCDDGNIKDGDGCSALCQHEGCGNGIVDLREVCDDGNRASGDGCSSNCLSEYCGNGVINAQQGEQCDDGNQAAGDGCSFYCLEERCGNGFTDSQAGEQCDDGNVVDGDGCSSTCRSEFCGNGVRETQLGEECDDGNVVNGDDCSSVCRHEVCGNRFVDVGETCDDGNIVSDDGCSGECLLEFSGMLPSLHLSVTDHCFNRCPMCGHWKRKELHQADLPRLIRFLQLAKDHLRLETVGLTGGDPMAHPELDVLLRWLIRNDVRFGIVTAGYVPEEKSTAQLQRAKWVRVSLDAVDEKIYSKTRGGHITFSQVEDSLIRMMKAGVNVQFGITINEINSLHLPDILRKIWTWKLNYGSISEVMVRAVCHHSDRLKAQQLLDSQEIEELASQLKGIGVSCDRRARSTPRAPSPQPAPF